MTQADGPPRRATRHPIRYRLSAGVEVKRIEVASAVDAAVDQLRDAILTGEMPPGEAIRIKLLAEQLGISHIPIREALRQLEAEGLVISSPRRTPVVAGVAVEELTALYELRRMVEVPTARLAVAQSGAGDLAAVRTAFRHMEATAGEPGSPDYWEIHRDLHWALIAAGANVWTQRVLEPLWRATERYVRLFVTRYRSPDDALQMHRALVAAYEGGDPDAFAAELTEHFAETERVVRAGYGAAMDARRAAAG
jgi:DNA-binding GntR family transcriptional regulator